MKLELTLTLLIGPGQKKKPSKIFVMMGSFFFFLCNPVGDELFNSKCNVDGKLTIQFLLEVKCNFICF